MLAQLPPWPRHLPRVFKDRVRLARNPLDGLPAFKQLDLLEAQAAARLSGFDPRMTGLTSTYNEAFFVSKADHTAVASTSAETSLIAGTNEQPLLPANYFLMQGSQLRGVSLLARGVLSTTGTPTATFQVRLGTTAGATYLSGTSVGVSAAITTASGVTNKWWELRLDLVCTTRGIGTGNSTLSGSGYVTSPGGFASPFTYPLEPTTPDTATWTATFDAGLTQYINLSATWGTSSASNTLTCKRLMAVAFG